MSIEITEIYFEEVDPELPDCVIAVAVVDGLEQRFVLNPNLTLDYENNRLHYLDVEALVEALAAYVASEAVEPNFDLDAMTEKLSEQRNQRHVLYRSGDGSYELCRHDSELNLQLTVGRYHNDTATFGALTALLASPPIESPDQLDYSTDPALLRELIDTIKFRHGVSQRDQAEALGVGWTTMRDWLNGKAKWPKTAQFALYVWANKKG